MTVESSKRKNASCALTIALILLVAIAFFLTSGFSKANFRINTETIISQSLKQPPLPPSVIGINETNSLNATDSNHNYSSMPIKSNPLSFGTLNSTLYNIPDMSGFFFIPIANPGQGQINGSDLTLPVSETDINSTAPISLDASKFVTYTYGGYSVQQPNASYFIFSFPDNISQGQISGSDALTLNTYSIQKIDFDAAFNALKINALGFDELAIFATSNTNTYKGTEFGIRMDLKDGLIYGYVQEPNGNYGDVNFVMQELMPNDGVSHHYSLIMSDSGVSFRIDGLDYGHINFPSNTDYSSLSFSICLVVHRFTDEWDSNGENMTAGNIFLNQQ